MSNRCCFAGHSDICDDFKDRLMNEIENLIVNKDVKEFWVGHYGIFDSVAAKTVRILKDIYEDIKLYLVLPYTTKIINENREYYYKNYDGILIADMPENTPIKYRILKCNEYMVNESDFLICYIEYSWGGASKTFEYAKRKKHIEIINIA